MIYSRMGRSGLVTSRLAFGTMTFNLGSEWMPNVASVGQDAATEMVSRCLDAGVNFFDSANGYSKGDAETALGAALKGRREDAVIATKLGFRQGPAITDAGLSRRHVLTQVEACLKRLGTEWIDLLIVHKTDFTTPMEETLAALDTVVQHGKARYIGFSNWPAWQAARALQFQRDNGLAPFVAAQMLYNLIDRDIETDVLPMMREMGVGLMAWSPLAQGLLTGKYDPDAMEAADGRLAEENFLGADPAVAKRAIEAVRDVAAAHGVAMPAVALAWVLAQPGATTAIFGASKARHLDDALAAATVELTADEIATLNGTAPAARSYPRWFDEQMTDALHKEALA